MNTTATMPAPRAYFVNIHNRARKFSDIVGPLTWAQMDCLTHNAPRWDSNQGNYGTLVKVVTPAKGDRVLTLDEWARWEGPTVKAELARTSPTGGARVSSPQHP